jgi:hypothetical protein
MLSYHQKKEGMPEGVEVGLDLGSSIVHEGGIPEGGIPEGDIPEEGVPEGVEVDLDSSIVPVDP